LRICAGCELPHLDGTDANDRCEACRSPDAALDPPDAALAAATEVEVGHAMAESWELVGSARATGYFCRVLREVAGRIDGAPADGQVVLVRDRAIRSLALPSGTVLLSVGTLEALEDEAELAFVLGHELAHVAAGDGARALVTLSLRGPDPGHGEDPRALWSNAAQDLIRLGYGDRREYGADAAAWAETAALGYDPQAAVRYLSRVRERTDRGDPELSDLALAHPPPALRIRRLEALRSLHDSAPDTARVDREVFRRAAGHSVLRTELEPVRPFDGPDGGRGLFARLRASKLFWVLSGLLLLVLLALLYGTGGST
jgi:predicted Zn-dependent protease